MASRLRTGPIYSQDVLQRLKSVALLPPSNDAAEDEMVFREKTSALQKFLHHGMARFSLESLKHILEDLLTSGHSDVAIPSQLRSVSDLRHAVKSTVTKREAGSLRSSDATAVIYMEHFFFAIYCLTEVKKIFDDLYADMYFSYYTEEDVSRQATNVSSSPRPGEDYSQFGISTLDQMTGSTQHKLRLTVKDVRDVLTRWANLLTEEEPDLENFDPESEQDLLLVQRSSRMEPVLRLLPDIFAKYYKCLELLKQWWVLAHDIYPELPFQRRPPSGESSEETRELSLLSPHKAHSPIDGSQTLDEEAVLNSELLEAKKAVKESAGVLKGLEEELEALEKREEKFDILKSTFDKVGEDIDAKTAERKDLWAARERLTHQFKGPEHEEIENRLNKIDGEIRLLEFQHALLSQDYVIHMELRPSIIRFHGDVAMRVHDARSTLDQQLSTLERLISEKEYIKEQTPSPKQVVPSPSQLSPALEHVSDGHDRQQEEPPPTLEDGENITSPQQKDTEISKTMTKSKPSDKIFKNDAMVSELKNLKNRRASVESQGKPCKRHTKEPLNHESTDTTKVPPQAVRKTPKKPNISPDRSNNSKQALMQPRNPVPLKTKLSVNTTEARRTSPLSYPLSPKRQAAGKMKHQLAPVTQPAGQNLTVASPIPRQGGRTIISSPPNATKLTNQQRKGPARK